MVVGVALALLGRGAACRPARLERGELRARLRVGLATEDPPGVDAGVRAVLAEAGAASHGADIVLAETGVGAHGAGGGALPALVDAPR